ncbi:hypothetical protein AQUCO_00900951v1 [Aquilegia coerulea]|uniref:Uncharacterized protein n=1 Tax=Aquilegia coerulea TaxID=218851 RepID=A0A2G5EG40_AQUCA|nr:hypothetical protein AQUCO_00900951v1 [Aquilegia coerulea]
MKKLRSCKKHIKSFKVPEGYIPIYVGKKRKRYVIPLKYLSRSPLKVLLEQSDDDFGEKIRGPILLPCSIKLFNEAIKHIKEEEKESTKHGNNNLQGSLRGVNVPRTPYP